MEHLEQRKKVTIMIAIMASMLFAALNQTIVGTALPRIVNALGGMEYFDWVFTVYMLASSVTAVLVGKLSDIYGRKPFIIAGIGIFIVGSFLCGTSATIFHLIAYRALQGLGGGMIISCAFTAIGDLFPPRERGRWQGMLAASFGLASVFGPTLGGYIVDHWDWHWVFWVFLPFGLVAFALIVWLFPSVKNDEKAGIDFAGAIFLTATIVPLLLAFSWAGNAYAWGSWPILLLFAGSLLSFSAFFITERRVKHPIMPLDLFKNSIFTVSNAVGFLIGMGMFGVIMYMPFFVQGVMGSSATKTGFIMMSMTLSMVASSTIIGQLITRTGRYKGFAVGGLIVMASGILSIFFMGSESSNLTAVINLMLVGIGLGAAFPVFTLTIQNAVEHKHLGVATSSAQLFRQMGGTIGVSLMGGIMSARMDSRISSISQPFASLKEQELAQQIGDPKLLLNPEQIARLKAQVPAPLTDTFARLIDALREALLFSLKGVFFTGVVMMVIAVIVSLFLKEIPLRTSNREPSDGKTENAGVQKGPLAQKPEMQRH